MTQEEFNQAQMMRSIRAKARSYNTGKALANAGVEALEGGQFTEPFIQGWHQRRMQINGWNTQSLFIVE
jgi:hypothetical protein